MKTVLICFFSAVLLAMLWVTIAASLERNLLDAGRDLWQDPWGKATIFDAYFAFCTIFLWIAYREPNNFVRGLWLVLFLLLGNIAIAAYFLKALLTLEPGASWHQLFVRRHLN